MKFASQHASTQSALQRWARPAKLCTASYYFWNQGFEWQKSQVGLLRTLIFEILRSSPSVIPHVAKGRSKFDSWERAELESTLRLIADQGQLPMRFCFFIDGLDEYDGMEEDVVEVLTFLAATAHIKLGIFLRRCWKTTCLRIHPSFRQEMAETFLITTEEVQPLPLFAFELLETERRDPKYAIEAPVEPLNSEEIRSSRVIWADRVQNRCGDLLDVGDGAHPTFLWDPVDFLHRTVPDFLRDSYSDRLKRELGSASDFNPLLSLCKVMLRLLKGLPKGRFSEEESFNRVIRLVDELLYYAHEVEKRSGNDEGNRYPESTMVALLDEVDRVNSRYAKADGVSSHWTNVRDLPRFRFLNWDEYHERGRPYLDYALRPLRVTPLKMPYHSVRDGAPVDVAMVGLLLSPPLSADPNRQVYVNDGRTVWALFLVSCLQMSQRDEAAGREGVKKA
ncbi:hypothetical protein RB595_005094 [Gaeumannomyces hyphopodioides]